MCKETFEHNTNHPASVEEMLSVYNLYYTGSPERYYIIPKVECAELENPIFYAEDDLTTEFPKSNITCTPYDSKPHTEYRKLWCRFAYPVNETFRKVPPAELPTSTKTALSYYFNHVNIK